MTDSSSIPTQLLTSEAYSYHQYVSLSIATDSIAFSTTTDAAQTDAVGPIALADTLAAGATEEFRFYFDDNSTGGGRSNNLTSFTITGTVPKPSTYALLAGLTGLTFAMLRRRRS